MADFDEILNALTQRGAIYTDKGIQNNPGISHFGKRIIQITYNSNDYQGGPAVANLARILSIDYSKFLHAGYHLGRWKNNQYIVDFAVESGWKQI